MLRFTKKRINPSKLKFVSTLTVSALIMIIVFFLTSSVMHSILKHAERQYFKSCLQTVEGYSNAIHYYLENYNTSLSSIYNEELFRSGNTKAIQDWLKENIPFIHEDFSSTFYVDRSLTAYYSSGNVKDISDRLYINLETLKKDEYYISDIHDSDYQKFPVFIVEKPVYNSDDELIGILCASVKLDALEKITSKIRIGNENFVCVQDRTGRFVVNPDTELVGKTYQPEAQEYASITSKSISEAQSGMVETVSAHGMPIDLFFTKIPECGWTLSVSFPKAVLDKIYRTQNSSRIMVLGISVVALVILLLLETNIMDFFYSNQLIEAMFDPLTKLKTRQRFEIEASRLMKKNPKQKFMLIESDIRGFKFINQNYGEEAADKMILFYSELLTRITKEFDGIIARGYADHFYSFIRVSAVSSAMKYFNKHMAEVIAAVKNYEIPFYPKFGITFFRPENKNDVTIKDLIGQVSFAKSTIKDNVLEPYAIYNSRLLEKINEEQFIEQSMEAALEKREFFVMYQPKIMLSSDKIVGAEALVRWKTADGKMLTPDKFITQFERNGFITKLDFYVYDCVFQFLDAQIKAGNPVVPISVNMSRNHNKPERFMQEFMRLFNKYKIPPHLIQVEILERSVMDNNTLCEITNNLHKEGFSVAMDDFGSGESSLNMLTKIPVDVLKFDRYFLLSSTNENGAMDEKAARFIESLIDLSKKLEKETVFEGVETQAQRDFLRAASCDQVQGYFYSRPLTEADFIAFLKKNI